MPVVLTGVDSFGWGVSQIIVGFTDNEISFMGVKEAIIKNTTDPGPLQDELPGLNRLVDMLLTGRTVPAGIGKVNTLLQSGQSIYNSGSTIIDAMQGNTADSPCKSSSADGFVLDYEYWED